MLLVGWLGLFLEHFNGLLSGLDLPRRAYVPPREEDKNSHHYCRCRLNWSALDFNFWSVSANRTLIKCQFFFLLGSKRRKKCALGWVNWPSSSSSRDGRRLRRRWCDGCSLCVQGKPKSRPINYDRAAVMSLHERRRRDVDAPLHKALRHWHWGPPRAGRKAKVMAIDQSIPGMMALKALQININRLTNASRATWVDYCLLQSK